MFLHICDLFSVLDTNEIRQPSPTHTFRLDLDSLDFIIRIGFFILLVTIVPKC